MDTLSIGEKTPEVSPEEAPHGCYDGWVYLGFEGTDENGEPIEVIERVRCRRCERREGVCLADFPDVETSS